MKHPIPDFTKTVTTPGEWHDHEQETKLNWIDASTTVSVEWPDSQPEVAE